MSPDAVQAAVEALPETSRVEAVLVTSDRPVRTARLTEVTGLTAADVKSAVEQLNESYDREGRVFRIVSLADGWQMMTQSDVAPVLTRLLAAKQQSRLTQAAMETLAIIAYRQPVLRAEIEAIRGVACGEVLRGLLERRLVRIAGRAEELGRPMLYGTSREFLRIFGLSGIDDLPEVEGLARTPSWKPQAAASTPEPPAESPDAAESPQAEEDAPQATPGQA
ncbi:MAG: SMC-Scp complex subunit ScpB [Phycisphaerales bacterium]|jgi:segregation and condensation protein B|nr:SMC-Scp complex subunit ScpB [Phycisphaerales bacterium]